MGYTGIKMIFEEYGVPHMEIIQASGLKEKLVESLNVTREEVTIASSINAVNFHPSVTFKLIRKAVKKLSQYMLIPSPLVKESQLATFQEQYPQVGGIFVVSL